MKNSQRFTRLFKHVCFKKCIAVLLVFPLLLLPSTFGFAENDNSGEGAVSSEGSPMPVSGPYDVMGKYYSTVMDSLLYSNVLVSNAYVVINGQVCPVYQDTKLQLRSNCYGYAFKMFYHPASFPVTYTIQPGNQGSFGLYKQQPGEFANKQGGLSLFRQNGTIYAQISNYSSLQPVLNSILTNSSITNTERIFLFTQLLQADAAKLGYSVTPYSGSSVPSATVATNKRLIALVVNRFVIDGEVYGDFHFYMQHSDNTWSHKPGYLEATNRCLDYNSSAHNYTLTNSNILSHALEGNYSGGAIQLFYITKDAVIDYSHENGHYASSVYTPLYSGDNAGNYYCASKYLGWSPTSQTSAACDYPGDYDCYSFVASQTKAYTISFSSNHSFNIVCSICDNNQSTIVNNTVVSSNGSLTTPTLQFGQGYTLRFFAPTYNSGPYSLNYDYSVSIT